MNTIETSKLNVIVPVVDHRELKAIAAKQGRLMREVVLEAIRAWMQKQSHKKT